jgi:hypothetical protein
MTESVLSITSRASAPLDPVHCTHAIDKADALCWASAGLEVLMKIASFLLTAIALISSAGANAAEDRTHLPTQFQGLWCLHSDSHAMKRASKACARDKVATRITATGYNSKYAQCKVLDTANDGKGNQLTKFSCRQTAAGRRETDSGGSAEPDTMNLWFTLLANWLSSKRNASHKKALCRTNIV